MLPTPTIHFGDIAQTIQLALGPVFLLTGIGAILNVMMGRLARIVDRGRKITEGPLADVLSPQRLTSELSELERRRSLTGVAITACVFAAFSVCVVIAVLFLEQLLQVNLHVLAGLVFTFGMLALVVGLAHFLREVHLATRTIQFEVPQRTHTPRDMPGGGE